MKRIILILVLLLLSVTHSEAASRFMVCTTACTWDGSTTSIWSTSSGGAGGASVPGVADDVILDANSCTGGFTCTITVNTTISINSLTMGACTGTTTGCILDFSVNNNNISMAGGNGTGIGLSLGGSGVRTLRMGSGTWLFTESSGTVIDATGTTNFTLTPGASTLKFVSTTASQREIVVDGLTYANLFLDANSSGGPFRVSGTATFANITMIAPEVLALTNSPYTATSLTITGSTTKQNYFLSASVASRVTFNVASGTQTLTWTGISGLTFAGGATFIANNSFNIGQNSGITINAPASSFGSSGACILGGWLLWRDLPQHINDNFPAWIEKVA